MRKLRILAVVCALILTNAVLYATIFGTVRGVVHDPQHRPDPGGARYAESAGF